MEKTNLATFKGNNEDTIEKLRYSYAHFYNISLSTLFLFAILIALNMLDKSLPVTKYISYGVIIFIIMILALVYILNYV